MISLDVQLDERFLFNGLNEFEEEKTLIENKIKSLNFNPIEAFNDGNPFGLWPLLFKFQMDTIF